jgi:hypothetical protein
MLTSRTVLRSCLVAVVTLAAPFALVAAARADVACGDQTCPKNYECKAAPVACPDIACAPNDANCTPPDCSGTVDTCVALPCASDAECADGMVCYTSTEQDCPTAPPCEKGQACPQPSDGACTTSSVSACVPKYMLPCAADADCGDGFTCEEEQACGCSGSAASGSADSGSASGSGTPMADAGTPMADAGTPPPPDCSCQPSGTKACNLKPVACNADADCASGFTCGDNPNGVCAADANGASSCSADPAKICLPPYAKLVSNAHLSKDATDSSASSGTGNTAGSPVPVVPAASTPNSPEASDDGGGCSMVPVPNHLGTSLGFAALALAGLAGARRRRAR